MHKSLTLTGDQPPFSQRRIGDPNFLGKGLAVPLIQEFLTSQFPHKKEVFIEPEASNTKAVHVYQKVGFKIVGEFIASWHPVPHYKMHLNMEGLHWHMKRKETTL